MDETGPERRLAAILAADMVGYSRLMEVDEPGTLARFSTHRLEVVDPAIAKNRGRIVKTTGDGMLVEFASVIDAVQGAVEIQRRMSRRNADVPTGSEHRVPDRHQSGRCHRPGGRHLRRRRQCRLAPGGVLRARRHLHLLRRARSAGRRMDVRFEDLGEQVLKNLARPIRAFRVCHDRAVPAHATEGARTPRSRSAESRRIVVFPSRT